MYSPDNYRGVHLTAVLSKLVERCVASVLVPFLEKTNAYGESQWAFQRGRSCADLVALLVLKWVLAWEEGYKVAVFFSDISGAFDRVRVERLLEKCR